MSARRLPHAKALRAMLEAATGKPCGLAQLPRAADGTAPVAPYSVLYPMGPTMLSGPPFGDDSADATWTYQVTCVGERADQALWMADRVLVAVLGRMPTDPQRYANPVPTPGRRETMRALDEDTGPEGDDASTVALRFTFTTTPEA